MKTLVQMKPFIRSSREIGPALLILDPNWFFMGNDGDLVLSPLLCHHHHHQVFQLFIENNELKQATTRLHIVLPY
jgi:hypothetical protein